LKPRSSNAILLLQVVLEQNPPKQGLKHNPDEDDDEMPFVLEQNPPKQGLKPNTIDYVCYCMFSFRAKSTKTRIETRVV